MPLVHRMRICPECGESYEVTYLQVGENLVPQNILRKDLPGEKCPHCEKDK